MTWMLGKYLQALLEEKGGKKAGWHQSRLAELSGLSPTQISWIIHGESSNKKGPPALQLDTVIALAKALSIPESKLIAAYKGKDPSAVPEDNTQVVVSAVNDFLAKLPPEILKDAYNALDKKRISEALADKLPEKKKDSL